MAESEYNLPVIHTLDRTRDELKQEMFMHLYGGPKPTIDYRSVSRDGKRV